MRPWGSAGRAVPSGRASPRRVVTVLVLGSCLLGSGTRAEPQNPGGPCAGAEAAVRSAAEALDKGEWAEAERHLQPVAESHAECSPVVLGLARLRAARGDLAEAEALFTRATALAPDEALGHALFAEYWLSRGQRARADYQSSVALSLDPDCPEALVASARVSIAKGRPQEAFPALVKAARLDPASAEAHYQLGVFLSQRKLYAQAAGEFEQVVALRPRDARAYDYLALSLEAVGAAERAEDAYRSGLKVNEGPFFDSFIDRNYGRFLLKERRLEESRIHLDRAVALLPNSRAVYYERAKLNLALERYAAAREDAERARSLRDPSGLVLDLQVYYLLATIYRRLGDTDLAEKYAELARTTPIPNQ
jgi:tetratricopeptide (TPR) repeat protein